MLIAGKQCWENEVLILSTAWPAAGPFLFCDTHYTLLQGCFNKHYISNSQCGYKRKIKCEWTWCIQLLCFPLTEIWTLGRARLSQSTYAEGGRKVRWEESGFQIFWNHLLTIKFGPYWRGNKLQSYVSHCDVEIFLKNGKPVF